MQAVGQRAVTPHFVLLVAVSGVSSVSAVLAGLAGSGPPATASRLGLVVTKKVGSSPERNRIKRLCRECFRLWPDLVPPGIDLVVIARDGAAELVLADVRREWERARPALLKRCAAVTSEAAREKRVEKPA